MKTIIPLNIFLIVIVCSGFAQTIDTLPSIPDEHIIVNKEYDDEGNLIRYDSTYIYKWQNDSIYGFPEGFEFLWEITDDFFPGDNQFNGFWGNDSIFGDSAMIFPYDYFGFNDPDFSRLREKFNEYFEDHSMDPDKFFENFDFPNSPFETKNL